MNEQSLPLSVLDTYAPPQPEKADALLKQALAGQRDKIVVIDDDPTGVQTVHGIHVYTDWTDQSILEGFEEENRMFFLLTNSRSMTQKETREVHEQIARGVMKASRATGKPFVIISRSDSTLRGHFPLETERCAGRSSAPAGSPTTARSSVPSSVREAVTRWGTSTMSRKAIGWFPPDRRSLPGTGRLATRIRGWMNGARKRPPVHTLPPKPPAFRWKCCAGWMWTA